GNALVINRLQHLGSHGMVEILEEMLTRADRRLGRKQALAELVHAIAQCRQHAHPCDHYSLALDHIRTPLRYHSTSSHPKVWSPLRRPPSLLLFAPNQALACCSIRLFGREAST